MNSAPPTSVGMNSVQANNTGVNSGLKNMTMAGGKRKSRNNVTMGGKRGKGKSRNNVTMGGKRKSRNNMTMGGKRENRNNMTMSGGKRKASPWNKLVKKIFMEMRRKDKAATFSDAPSPR